MSAVKTLDQPQQHAADELIAVTGDKTIKRTWDLADAILAATPNLLDHELGAIRKAAVDKAGHEEFWTISRLKQLGKTAERWQKGNRVADVSLDAHMEAFRGTGSTAAARQVLLKLKKSGGEATIRQVRAELGKNGTTAQPPRVDKAGADELWRRLPKVKSELKKYLRGRLIQEGRQILAFADLFNDLAAQVNALNAPAADAAIAAPAPADVEQQAPAARRNRRKSL